MSALLGARSLLEERSIEAILLEVSRSSYAEVREFLLSYGYELHYLNTSGRLTKVTGGPPDGTVDTIVIPG